MALKVSATSFVLTQVICKGSHGVKAKVSGARLLVLPEKVPQVTRSGWGCIILFRKGV